MSYDRCVDNSLRNYLPKFNHTLMYSSHWQLWQDLNCHSTQHMHICLHMRDLKLVNNEHQTLFSNRNFITSRRLPFVDFALKGCALQETSDTHANSPCCCCCCCCLKSVEFPHTATLSWEDSAEKSHIGTHRKKTAVRWWVSLKAFKNRIYIYLSVWIH